MKLYNPIAFGWKYNKGKRKAVIKKKSQVDFVISIIIAFLIIFIVSQFLAQLDQSIRLPFTDKELSLINPLAINTASAANEEAFKMIQSHREINIVKGKGFTFEIGFKNKTNYTWTRAGAKSVDLKLVPPYTRNSVLRHKFWRDIETPAWLKGKQAKPGWLAYYKFALEAPRKAGVYKEKFVLVSYADGHILSGSEFEIILNVWDDASQFPKKNTKVVKSPAARKAVTKPANIIKPKGLTEICMEIKPSDFQTAIDQRLLDECLKIGIKVTAEGVSQIDLTPEPLILPPVINIVNNNTSTNTTSSTNNTTTNFTISNSNLPIIRVGLFNTRQPIIIKANSTFKIKDSNKTVLTTVPANSQVSMVFNFSTRIYTFTANGASMSASSYLRLEPDNQSTVFEIISYENRPGWNPSLNDNKFLGDLEIRYSPQTTKLWVINELDIERYLKGLAESSNSSPLEYQKALITAARTYAMYHYNRGTKHADEYFTLDAKYDQVYKGYGSQTRLTKVSQAVEQTRGQIVTYNNELAITPYFSYSDGRTRNWEEVWGGSSKPWLRSVKEPAGYDKTTMYGHGVGMSARGALLLAVDHSYNFEQILKYYYTGIELKNIY